MRAWILSAVLLAVAAATGCGLLPETSSIVPRDCGFPADATIVWAGTGSLAGLGLEAPAGSLEFPEGAMGDVYVVAQRGNRDAFCAVLDADTEAQLTISGVTPEGWEPPDSGGPPS